MGKTYVYRCKDPSTETFKHIQNFITETLNFDVKYQRVIYLGKTIDDPTQLISSLIQKPILDMMLLMRVDGGE